MANCPKYKCPCILPQCDPASGKCAAAGNPLDIHADQLITTNEGNIMKCPQDQETCTYGACLSSKMCQGAPCPRDNKKCALLLCVNKDSCAWDQYYSDPKERKFKSVISAAKVEGGTKPAEPVKTTYKPVVHKPPCHNGMVEVWGGLHKVRMYLGGRNDWVRWADIDQAGLTLSLLGDRTWMHEQDDLVPNAHAMRLLPPALYAQWPRMSIEWPDFGIPPLNRKWWDTLCTWLIDQADQSEHGFGLAIHCEGGHGRTGTAAAIIATKLGMVPDEQPDAVAWLREVYCKEVVEADEQIKYIMDMTDTVVHSEARDIFGYGKGMGSWGNYGYEKHTQQGAFGFTSPSTAGTSAWVEGYNGTESASAGRGIEMPRALPPIRTHLQGYATREDIQLDGKLSKNRRKKLLALWDRREKKRLNM